MPSAWRPRWSNGPSTCARRPNGRPTARSLGGLGLGSRFTVCLPCLAEPADPAQGATHAHAGAQDGEGLLIMVVDDNVDAAGMLGMLLEASGHRVLDDLAAGR